MFNITIRNDKHISTGVVILTVRHRICTAPLASHLRATLKKYNLTVNAKNDTVSHFGEASKITITAVAPHSYHEYGEVRYVKVTSGRFVAESGAKVVAVYAEKDAAKIDNNSGTIENAYKAKEVTTVSGNVVLTDLPEGAKADDIATGVTMFAGGAGTADNPYLLKTKDNIKNMEKTAGNYKLVDDITVNEEVYLSGKTWVLDLNGHELSLFYMENSKVNNGSTLYIARGTLSIKDSSEKNTGAVLGSSVAHPNRPNYVYSAIRIGLSGKLNIYGGIFKARAEQTSCIYTFGKNAVVNIYGGIFETASPSNGIYYVLNHEDGKDGASYNNKTGNSKMIVSGGKFKNYNPGVTPVDPVNTGTGKIVLGEGCTTTQDGEWYVVSK